MVGGSQVEVKKVDWSERVAQGITRAAGDDLKEIKAQVQTGAASCFEFVGLGFVVVRIEHYSTSKEFVIVAGEGRSFKTAAPILRAMAKRSGCDCIRTHTKSRAIARLWSRYGLALDEYVLKGSI